MSAGSRGPLLLVAIVAAACVLLSITYPVFDPDLWQHLAVGRHLWTAREIPHAQIWTWPAYGEPAITHSWLFRALLWPFWAAAGEHGITAWRWLTTLGAFALLWAVARRLGARGLVPLVVIAFAALTWRQRSMARPETLVAVLLALELLILETRRAGGRDRAWWLVLVLWAWVQAHVSFPLGFAVLGAYALADLLAAPRRARLLAVGLAALAAAFVNPYGAALVWQPFAFALFERAEPLYRTIDELRGPDWSQQLRNGLPLLVAGWPLLALLRVARQRADVVELLLCALFTAMALASQRFLGFLALVAVPFVSRDLAEWLATLTARRGRRGARPIARDRRARDEVAAPADTAAISPLAALGAAALCVAISIPEWLRPAPRPGFGLDLRGFPVAATEFMAAHGVRGRGFNYFYHGGWLLWRFHPDRERLPFMDIHQAGTPEIRDLYLRAFYAPAAWRALDDRFRFEWLLLRRVQADRDSVLDYADADTAFAPVFLDDDAALYVRRAGAMAAIADSFGFAHLDGGGARLGALGDAVARDSALRTVVRAELERAAASSPRNARAHSLLANVAMTEARWDDAVRHLEHALAVDPVTRRAWERLRMIAEARGDAAGAARYREQERRAMESAR